MVWHEERYFCSDFSASSFTLAAYGQLLAVHGATSAAVPAAAALTSLGYSGEHFDAKAQQQYLRARWYDPASGRFNRLDPFAGNVQDPQSLHKYAYVHGDPIQLVDPAGKFAMGLGGFLASVAIGGGINAEYSRAVTGAGGDIVAGLMPQSAFAVNWERFRTVQTYVSVATLGVLGAYGIYRMGQSIAKSGAATNLIGKYFSQLRDLVTPPGVLASRITSATGLPTSDIRLFLKHFREDQHLIEVGDKIVRVPFERYPYDESLFEKIIRGDRLDVGEVRYLRELVVHEAEEARIMQRIGPELEEAFRHGQIENAFRAKMAAIGRTPEQINADIIYEEGFVPFRVAHYIAHYTGFQNPRPPVS